MYQNPHEGVRGRPRPLQWEAVPSQLIHLEVCALALERRAAGGGRAGPSGQRGQMGEERETERAARGAFWLGAMAPDAWGVAGLTRGQTHFWSLEDDTSGVVRLGRAYPGLCDPLRRGARERAFLAGYLCHLVTDEQWTFCVYRPYFGRHSVFGASAEGRIVQLALQGEWEQGLRDQKGLQLRGWLRELAGAESGDLPALHGWSGDRPLARPAAGGEPAAGLATGIQVRPGALREGARRPGPR